MLELKYDPEFVYWIFRSAFLLEQAQRIERQLLKRIQSDMETLSQLDKKLLASEKLDLGQAKHLRELAKDDFVIRDVLEDINNYIKSSLWMPYYCLHSVIRLRTTMPAVDYSVSAPHQDSILWPDEPPKVNMWLSLCDITEMLAPLCIYAPTEEKFDYNTNSYMQIEISNFEASKYKKKVITTKYGDLVMFFPESIHHSLANTTPDRIRWSIDWRLKELL